MRNQNSLYYGDNLDVLRRYVADASVDLVYLDPPFKSNQDYNVLFAEKDGSRAASQIKAFEDTWMWDQVAESAYVDVVQSGGKVSETMQAFRTILGTSDMMAYLAMMAPRLVELRRVLKQTGSIYLHCDPTASHYLKLLLDSVFGAVNFRSEIIWRRTSGHNKISRQYGPIHDVLLFYAKDECAFFEPKTRPVMRGYVKEWFTGEDSKGPFRTNMLTGPGTRTGDSGRPWRGFDPTKVGRHWAIPRSLSANLPDNASSWNTQQKLDYLYDSGEIYIPRDGAGQPKYIQRLGVGIPYQDIWAYQPYTQGTAYNSNECIDEDVKWLQHNKESLGYPTQKPEGLLERIIQSSCPDNGVVLDPFCGCGTAVAVAQRLNRRWIGIDITHIAITLMKARLKDAFGEAVKYQVIGEPVSVQDAAALAASDPYQFQWWALGLVGARPADQKKGADHGIDGRLYFFDDGSGKAKQVIFSVKAGHTQVAHVRDLIGVLNRENAAIGVLITMQEPTGPMKTEAVSAGFYESPGWNKRYARVQIRPVAELLAGRGIEHPPTNQTFKQAPKAKRGGTATKTEDLFAD